MSKRFTSTRCPNCQASFDRVAVDFDEDGGYAALAVHVCQEPGCGALLCSACAQFHCDECGDLFCADHLVSVPDGTPVPLHCCPTCAAGFEALPAAIPAQRATERTSFPFAA